ncbi:restriction endonuclease subunit S [Bacillus sp. 1P10SD]|uniref:restriction endonuclease subunit S n=1 Tax=Bacillus sp. 1P10SD TaxID=3132265 RepID=UPI0039A5C7B4
MNAPKLRFNEFKDEWKAKDLKQVLKVNSGKDYKHLGIGDIPVYGTGGYMTSVDSSLSEEDAVGIGRKGSIDKPQKLKAPFWTVDTLFYCTPKDNNDLEFIYVLFDNINWKKHDESTGVPSLSKNTIENIIKYIPSTLEQIKIGEFFNKMDSKIQLQQEKIGVLKEQKKGYIQRIFNQELRFKDPNGSAFPKWLKNVKAESLFESVSNKNHNGDYPVLSATQDNGMVLRDSLERHMAFNEDNLKSYKLVEKNDFIISLRSFQGGIEFSNLQGLVSPAYTVFKSKSELVYDLYFAKLFKTENFISRLSSTTYGIRDGKAISYKDFSTLRFNIPSIEEQMKIAEFLDLLDLKILNENKKLEQLQNQKHAFMQQMFI